MYADSVFNVLTSSKHVWDVLNTHVVKDNTPTGLSSMSKMIRLDQILFTWTPGWYVLPYIPSWCLNCKYSKEETKLEQIRFTDQIITRKQLNKLKCKKVRCFRGRNVCLVQSNVCLLHISSTNEIKQISSAYHISLLDSLDESKRQCTKFESPSWTPGPL